MALMETLMENPMSVLRDSVIDQERARNVDYELKTGKKQLEDLWLP